MRRLNHKVFFLEEFFGSRLYNTKTQKEHFFNKESTFFIKKILFGNPKNNQIFTKIENQLVKNGLLTSDIIFIKNKKQSSLTSPLRISINISKKCNLRCKHCLSNSGNNDQDELIKEDLFKLIDQMRNAGCFFLAIGGGEPLLRNDLFELIKYARKNFIAISIITNGLLINKEVAEELNKLKINTITVSIDGLEKNHDQIRGKGNFKKTIKNIKILKKYCKTARIAMRVTVNSLNSNECKNLIRLAENLSLDLIRFTPILLLGRAKENQNLLLNQDEYINFIRNTQNIKSRIKVILPNNRIDKNRFIYSEEFGCHCGKEVCWITQSGDLYPCIFFGDDYIAGNIKNEDLLDLWAKAKNMVKLCGNEMCNNCADYKNCRGGCRSRALWKYNNINAVDPFCLLKNNLWNQKNQ